jgi:Raf kinase inhibitor-like YbhB/YbcL family protein
MAGMGGAAPFALTSPSFMNKMGCGPTNVGACDKIPKLNWGTMIGGPDPNQSPELDWTAGPSGTLSYAIVLYDLSNSYTHWAVWNIPATTNKLPASLPAGSNPAGITGAKQASFSPNKDAYAGPGALQHVYQLTVYALKVATISPTLPGNNPQDAVRNLLEGSADVLKKVSLAAASVQ